MAMFTTSAERLFAEKYIDAWFAEMMESIVNHKLFNTPDQVLGSRVVPFPDLPPGQCISLRLEYFTPRADGTPARWQRSIEEFPSWHVPDEPDIPPV